jgi:hypothetical protein
MSFQALWKFNRSGCCSVIPSNPGPCTNEGDVHTCSPRYPYLIPGYPTQPFTTYPATYA